LTEGGCDRGNGGPGTDPSALAVDMSIEWVVAVVQSASAVREVPAIVHVDRTE
jgi:hypothetical protein